MLHTNRIKSTLFDDLLANNRMSMAGFKRWRFQPGMLFNSRETWWGDKNPRATPHEGLDLCCFEDRDGKIKNLAKEINLPAAFAGEIIKIGRDFLGQSIFISHEIFSEDRRQLCSAYGHTKPRANLSVGLQVAAGEIIAVVSFSGRKSAVPPHLHLTFAWIPVPIDPERLNWPNLGRAPAITLIDPLTILSPLGEVL
jgi:murein DD-endopeptidase MepM/ murein hydrolase activator NlpD